MFVYANISFFIFKREEILWKEVTRKKSLRSTPAAEKITLGVFENNPVAHGCYKAVGFKDVESDKPWYYRGFGEAWKCIEMDLKRSEL